MMHATVADIIREVEHIAPPRLAEEWDNIGLQVGQYNWSVQTVRVALDPGPEVVAAAADEKVDLLITHHPLIFSPLRSINFTTPEGRAIQVAAVNKMAIYTAHTNLDSARRGLNRILAQKIGLKNSKALVPTDEPDSDEGLGRIGKLSRSTNLGAMVLSVKKRLLLDSVRVVGDKNLKINRVALCTGSGSGLIQPFFSSGAQVYVSGDLRYHEARLIEAKGLGAIDIGHFASEHIMMASFASDLQQRLDKVHIDTRVEPWGLEKDPFILC